MHWKRLSLRRVLLSTLILLGGWGVCVSLYQVKQSWEEYERSKDLVNWAQVAGQIMSMAQHLGYERGRTAVVLAAPHRVTDADRQFIMDHRFSADASVKAFSEKIASLPNIGYDVFQRKWGSIQKMRQSVDRERELPLTQRDPTLASRWIAEMTDFLGHAETLARNLVRHYRQSERANRLNTIGLFSFRLRLSIGSESSMFAQHLASNKPMTQKEKDLLNEMRGAQKAMWSEIDRNVDYIANEDLLAIVVGLKKRRDDSRAMQDSVMDSWQKRRPVKTSVSDLTSSANLLLDGISDFVTHVIDEGNRTANARMDSAQRVLIIHVILAFAIAAVTLFAILYVLRNVVRPLEEVDERLRSIHVPLGNVAVLHANQIERLSQTANTLQTVFDEKGQLEAELREMAFYDPLTQLSNRRLMEDRLHQLIMLAKRQNSMLGFLYIDLDHFKPINDDLGHEVGDWLLWTVADRIVSCIRESDAAARIGGDEFVVLLPDLVQSDGAKIVAEKIRTAVAQPFIMPNGKQFDISSSIGVAVYPVNADNVQDLMRSADDAMYLAKYAGRNKVMMAPI